MGLLIRVAAYAISMFTIWQFALSGENMGMAVTNPLALDTNHAMVLGVCAGLSNYTGFDVTVVRLFWALSCVYRGLGVGLYIIAFLIMPAAG